MFVMGFVLALGSLATTIRVFFAKEEWLLDVSAIVALLSSNSLLRCIEWARVLLKPLYDCLLPYPFDRRCFIVRG